MVKNAASTTTTMFEFANIMNCVFSAVRKWIETFVYFSLHTITVYLQKQKNMI